MGIYGAIIQREKNTYEQLTRKTMKVSGVMVELLHHGRSVRNIVTPLFIMEFWKRENFSVFLSVAGNFQDPSFTISIVIRVSFVSKTSFTQIQRLCFFSPTRDVTHHDNS